MSLNQTLAARSEDWPTLDLEIELKHQLITIILVELPAC